MLSLRPFQIVLLGTFAFLAILAIIVIRGYNPPPDPGDVKNYGDEVVIWGTVSQDAMDAVIRSVIEADAKFRVVTYKYFDPRTFDDELVNAIAEDRSPDLVLLRSDSLVRHRAKLIALSYDTISQRFFKDNYVDGAEIFTLQDGVYALPMAVDPLVMYWNRDLFASNGLAQPPRSWESLVAEVVPSLTIRDTNRNIIRSAVGLGEYRNIENGKGILISLAMQSGSQLVYERGDSYVVALDRSPNDDRAPLDAALEFYTDFSNSASPLYTWNRAQPSDENAFVSEDLAIYFGLGSEAESIADKNPNLNFDVAQIPQGATASIERTYGQFYGLAIPKASRNPQGSFAAALKLSTPEFTGQLARAVGMSSPHRSVIAGGDSSPYRQVVFQSALIARAWLDPDPEVSDTILGEMVEDVVSNRARVNAAVTDAVRRLSFEY